MYTRVCTGCNNTFDTNNARQKRCVKDCGRASKNVARKRKSDNNELTFIGVDGEGVDRPDGEHDYIMLSVGDKTLINADGSRLSHEQIFAFLYECYEANKSAAFIGFYLGYDFTQWTRSLPEDAAFQLWSKRGQEGRKPKRSKNPDPWPVLCGEWEFDVMTKRRFRLRRHECVPSKREATICRLCQKQLDYSEYGEISPMESFTIPDNYFGTEIPDTDFDAFWDELTPRRKHVGNSWMYICDTGSFWQMSLMSAINPEDWIDGNGDKIELLTQDEYETIKRGKATRSKVVEYGDISGYEETREYNILENAVLARMTAILNRGFSDIGLNIRPREWYGPGRAAQLWLDLMAKEQPEGHTIARKDIQTIVPEYACEAGRMSYYGGWFEITMSGHVLGEVEEDDINSAYPWVISTLPCLHHGVWKEGTGEPEYKDGSYYLLYGTVRGSNPFIGAMPYRSPKGRILRPHNVKGWYWKHETDMARKAGLVDSHDVESYVSYDPCNCPPPLNAIAELYLKRLSVGKKGPQGKALKLIYNSAYGKMAQSVGSPKFGNPLYGSLITAGCRTRILEAIATHPVGAAAVCMIATDGIYFTTPHPDLEFDGQKLGAWDRTTKTDLTLFMPGVYWDKKLRDVLAKEVATGKQADKLPSKTRGINVRDLANSVGRLDELFYQFMQDIMDGKEVTWPKFDVTVAFDMTSATQAIARGKWHTAGNITTGGIRTIFSHPGNKRNFKELYVSDRGVCTGVYEEGDELESTPYDKHFGMDIKDNAERWGIDTPDGDFNDLWAFAMGGDI